MWRCRRRRRRARRGWAAGRAGGRLGTRRRKRTGRATRARRREPATRPCLFRPCSSRGFPTDLDRVYPARPATRPATRYASTPSRRHDRTPVPLSRNSHHEPWKNTRLGRIRARLLRSELPAVSPARVSSAVQKNPHSPLTFHTMPPEKGKQVARPVGDATVAATEGPDKPAPASNKNPRLHACTTTIPRLISVVEIVKREYLKTLDPALSQSGKLSGLFQYNQIGELEQPNESEGTLSSEEERQREIALALSGKRQ